MVASCMICKSLGGRKFIFKIKGITKIALRCQKTLLEKLSPQTQHDISCSYTLPSKTYSFPNRQTCRKHGWSGKQKQKQNKKNSKCFLPEVLEDAAASPGDLSGHNTLLAVYSTQPRLHYNPADHLVGPQQEQELLDPFSCSILPKPLYNQPVQLELEPADLLFKKQTNKTRFKFLKVVMHFCFYTISTVISTVYTTELCKCLLGIHDKWV